MSKKSMASSRMQIIVCDVSRLDGQIAIQFSAFIAISRPSVLGNARLRLGQRQPACVAALEQWAAKYRANGKRRGERRHRRFPAIGLLHGDDHAGNLDAD